MAAKTRRPAGPVPVFPGAEAVSEDLEFLAVVLGPGAAARRLGEWVGIGAACLRGHPGTGPGDALLDGTAVDDHRLRACADPARRRPPRRGGRRRDRHRGAHPRRHRPRRVTDASTLTGLPGAATAQRR
ncbi:hypothetical protein IOD13_05130 [Brevibacterium casei]|nr:hypothetical protein [Brevibacterium casei]